MSIEGCLLHIHWGTALQGICKGQDKMLEQLTYDFDAPLKCFVVGLGANKSWKKGMVDVDGVMSMPITEVF